MKVQVYTEPSENWACECGRKAVVVVGIAGSCKQEALCRACARSGAVQLIKATQDVAATVKEVS